MNSLDWLKVWVHCIKNFHKNFKKDYHLMCSRKDIFYFSNVNPKKTVIKRKYFCSCGYMNDNIPWEEFKKNYL